jgi:hypothetical protein
VQAIVEEGVRSGAFTVSHPRLLVFALIGMSNWVYHWYDPAGVWDADTVADGLIDLVERGYLVSPARRRSDVLRHLAHIERRLHALRPLLAPVDGRRQPLARHPTRRTQRR